MIHNIEQLEQSALQAISAAETVEQLQEIRQNVLGRKAGELTMLLKQIKDLSIEEKKAIGPRANTARTSIEAALDQKQEEIESAAESLGFDITLPGIAPQTGTLHPMTHVMNDLVAIFRELGFIVHEGPELESEVYNFEALNIPETHPARDIQDTFFIDESTPIERREETRDLSGSKWLMRTQTSNMQIRMMEEYGAPLRAVIPGRVFRNEATDATHDHTFYQLEGFVVDENISIAQLLWFLTQTMTQYYKKEVSVRLRPGYFPFVEPGYEIDLSCVFCDGKGCSVCKKTGWIEMGGSGMIHPNVLRASGLDPEKVTGFAFGLGISRIPMLKYGIKDIRTLHENDLDLLKQF